MTRQDHINRLKVIKGYCCAQKDQESLDYAIETMRKYQKIVELSQEPILDKIRAEIEEKADGSVGEIADGLYDALEIIDKYKAESEADDGNV